MVSTSCFSRSENPSSNASKILCNRNSSKRLASHLGWPPRRGCKHMRNAKRRLSIIVRQARGATMFFRNVTCGAHALPVGTNQYKIVPSNVYDPFVH